MHTPPIHIPTLANAQWESFVDSMTSAFDGTNHAIHLAIGVAILAVIWINIRLARWINRSMNEHHDHHATPHNHANNHNAHHPRDDHHNHAA